MRIVGDRRSYSSPFETEVFNKAYGRSFLLRALNNSDLQDLVRRIGQHLPIPDRQASRFTTCNQLAVFGHDHLLNRAVREKPEIFWRNRAGDKVIDTAWRHPVKENFSICENFLPVDPGLFALHGAELPRSEER